MTTAIAHKPIGVVRRNPPQLNLAEYRRGTSKDGKWLTNGHWLVRVDTHPSLAGIPKGKPSPISRQDVMAVLPNSASPLPLPQWWAQDEYGPPLYGWEHEPKMIWLTAEYCDWITKALKLRVGLVEPASKPQAIMTPDGVIVGAIMPHEAPDEGVELHSMS